jgi:hypothetical protein
VSTWFDESIRCPHCELEQVARLAHGVHVARAPEVRDQVLARTFHAVTCSGCAGAFVAQRPLIYTDIDRKHWIQVALEDERPRWPELEAAVMTVFERAFTGSPLARDIAERMKVRLVFGLEDLREKLVIWAANLDDAVIECLKVELIRRDPALLRSRLVVDTIGTDGTLSIRADGQRVLIIDGTTVTQFESDPRLPTRFPELFGGTYVCLDRLTGHRYRWAEPQP